MRNRLLAHITEYNLIVDTETTLLAVSGGKDSVAMAHLFSQLNFKFAIAHCNFKLRVGKATKTSNLSTNWLNSLELLFTPLLSIRRATLIKWGFRCKWQQGICVISGFMS